MTSSSSSGLQANRIKLILMDCEMPVLDGYEASKKIRDSEFNLNKSNLIFSAAASEA